MWVFRSNSQKNWRAREREGFLVVCWERESEKLDVETFSRRQQNILITCGFQLLLNEVHSDYYKRVGLLQFFCSTISRFSLEYFFSSQVSFSRFRSSFLSDVYCSHSEVNLVANIKSFLHIYSKGLITQWSERLVMYLEINGSKSSGANFFSTRLSFESNSSDISWFVFFSNQFFNLQFFFCQMCFSIFFNSNSVLEFLLTTWMNY